MAAVARAVKEMDMAAIAAFQRAGEGTFAGHALSLAEVKVRQEGGMGVREE